MKLFVILLMIGPSLASFINGHGSGGPRPHYDCAYCQPEQVHIAFGEKPTDIVVTWSTFNDSLTSRVQYGKSVMDREAVGSAKLFVDGGRQRRRQYIHNVLLADLEPDTHYVYHAGSEYGWSDMFRFKTPPAGEDWVVRAAIYGDMGSENAHSMSYLQDEAQRGHFDVILHVGDFAYDMDSDEARVGDEFMRQIQPLAAAVPYMTCPGNHEEKYNFSNYAARFSMPGPDSSLFYSFDLGPVHFVSISTEVYYYLNYGAKLIVNQYEWLKQDLETANRPENRARRPWVVLFGHRPMYCSDQHDPDCAHEYTRTGIMGHFVKRDSRSYSFLVQRLPIAVQRGNAASVMGTFVPRRARPWIVLFGHRPMYCSNSDDILDCDYEYTRFGVGGFFGLEPLLKQYGVDVVVWAHEHSYERTWPLYDNKVYNGSADHPYINPGAPIHVITGSAGCKENTDKFIRNSPAWSAFRSSDYGYSRLEAHNATHLYMEQVDVDLQGKVIDSFWVVKTTHAPYDNIP